MSSARYHRRGEILNFLKALENSSVADGLNRRQWVVGIRGVKWQRDKNISNTTLKKQHHVSMFRTGNPKDSTRSNVWACFWVGPNTNWARLKESNLKNLWPEDWRDSTWILKSLTIKVWSQFGTIAAKKSWIKFLWCFGGLYTAAPSVGWDAPNNKHHKFKTWIRVS